jgi:hypothetical protein
VNVEENQKHCWRSWRVDGNGKGVVVMCRNTNRTMVHLTPIYSEVLLSFIPPIEGFPKPLKAN